MNNDIRVAFGYMQQNVMVRAHFWRSPPTIYSHFRASHTSFTQSAWKADGIVTKIIIKIREMPFAIQTPDISQVYCSIRFTDNVLQKHIPLAWIERA